MNKLYEDKDWRIQVSLMFILFISLFFPFYITALVFVGESIYLAYKGKLKGAFKNTSLLTRLAWVFIAYSLVVSLVHENVLGVGISLIFAIFHIYFTYYVEYVPTFIFNYFLNITLILSFFLALMAILEFYDLIPEWDYTFIHPAMGRTHANRAEATFFNPNYYAMMLEFFIIIGFYKFHYTKRPLYRVIIAGITFFNFLALYATGNRTTIAVIILAIFIFYYVIGYKKIAMLATTISAFFLLILILSGNFPRVDSLIFGIADRFQIWETALESLKDNWLFGQGPMTYGNTFAQYGGKETTHSHNLYIDVLLNYGVFGTGIILYLSYRYLKVINDMRRYPELRPALGMIFTLVAIVLLHGFTDIPIQWIQTGGFFLMIILMAPNMLKAAENERISKAGSDGFKQRGLMP